MNKKDELRDIDIREDYFNSQYADSSSGPEESLSPSPLSNQKSLNQTSNIPKSNSTLENRVIKPIPLEKVSNKFLFEWPKVESHASTSENIKDSKEISLTDMGFSPKRNIDENETKQPKKTSLLVLIEKMIKSYSHTDIVIEVQKTLFNCHLLVLKAYSKFFEKLDDLESIVLPVERVTPRAFTMVYNWMITNDPIVQRDGILELFNAAQFLQIQELCAQCWVFLDDPDYFNEDTAFLLYLESRAFDEHVYSFIKDLMLNRIGRFFLTMVSSKEYVELRPDEVCAILEKNTIGIHSEAEVFMAAIRWLDHDWENRKSYMLDIIKCVRFALMLPWQLLEYKRNADSLQIKRIVQDKVVQEWMEDGFSYVTARYWYADDAERTSKLERYNLVEPNERLWMKDATFTEKFGCPNQYCISYESFLNYLEMIRNMGVNYYKTFQYYDKNPNLALKIVESDVNKIDPKLLEIHKLLELIQSGDINLECDEF